MLIPPSVKVVLATEPVDLRASFYRLASYVRTRLGRDPQDGSLYVFIGRRGNLVKVLYWDRNGYCVLARRLERGRFRLRLGDIPPGATHHEVDLVTLAFLLEGIDLGRVRPRPPLPTRRFGVGRRAAMS